jgi:hypothetical protein
VACLGQSNRSSGAADIERLHDRSDGLEGELAMRACDGVEEIARHEKVSSISVSYFFLL